MTSCTFINVTSWHHACYKHDVVPVMSTISWPCDSSCTVCEHQHCTYMIVYVMFGTTSTRIMWSPLLNYTCIMCAYLRNTHEACELIGMEGGVEPIGQPITDQLHLTRVPSLQTTRSHHANWYSPVGIRCYQNKTVYSTKNAHSSCYWRACMCAKSRTKKANTSGTCGCFNAARVTLHLTSRISST